MNVHQLNYTKITGPPKALNLVASQTVLVERGQDATLFGAFCSDPIPQTTMWEINEADTLEAGTGKGRFVAEPLSTVSISDTIVSTAEIVQGQ